MGLEAVEIIMATEEEFQIAIPDSEAFECDTVGQLVDVVLSHLRRSTEDPCPSQQGFYAVRKELMEQVGLSRSAIKPDSILNDLIPIENRHITWNKLINALSGEVYSYTMLVRPKWLDLLIVLIFPFIVFRGSLVWLPLNLFWIGLFPAILTAYLGKKVTNKLKTQFPSTCGYVRDLVPIVRTFDCNVWSKDNVFVKIREIAVDQLGVKHEQVKLGTHWVNDLGVG